MSVAIVKKAFEDRNKSDSRLPFYTPNLDKILLKAFNRLSYNCEVSRPLVARFLLNLLHHYTPNTPIKSISISVLKDRFLLLISRQNFNTINDVACVNTSKIPPYFIFEYYFQRSLCFLKLFLYEYYRVISIVKRKCK